MTAPPPPGPPSQGGPGWPQQPPGLPPQPPPAFGAAPPRQPGNRRLVIVGVAMFVLGAAIAAGITAVVSGGSNSGSGNAVGTAPITLPARLGNFQLQKDIKPPGDTTGQQAKNAAAQQAEADANARRLSALHNGASVAITTYATPSLDSFATATVIRTRLDPLYVYEANPRRLGLAVPPEQTKSFGDVTCIVHNPSTPTGGTPAADQIFAEVCQRSSDTLTVQIRGLITAPPSASAHLVDELYNAVS